MLKTYQLNYVRSNFNAIIQELHNDPRLTIHVKIREKLVAVITGPESDKQNHKDYHAQHEISKGKPGTGI